MLSRAVGPPTLLTSRCLPFSRAFENCREKSQKPQESFEIFKNERNENFSLTEKVTKSDPPLYKIETELLALKNDSQIFESENFQLNFLHLKNSNFQLKFDWSSRPFSIKYEKFYRKLSKDDFLKRLEFFYQNDRETFLQEIFLLFDRLKFLQFLGFEIKIFDWDFEIFLEEKNENLRDLKIFYKREKTAKILKDSKNELREFLDFFSALVKSDPLNSDPLNSDPLNSDPLEPVWSEIFLASHKFENFSDLQKVESFLASKTAEIFEEEKISGVLFWQFWAKIPKEQNVSNLEGGGQLLKLFSGEKVVGQWEQTETDDFFEISVKFLKRELFNSKALQNFLKSENFQIDASDAGGSDGGSDGGSGSGSTGDGLVSFSYKIGKEFLRENFVAELCRKRIFFTFVETFVAIFRFLRFFHTLGFGHGSLGLSRLKFFVNRKKGVNTVLLSNLRSLNKEKLEEAKQRDRVFLLNALKRLIEDDFSHEDTVVSDLKTAKKLIENHPLERIYDEENIFLN